MKKNTPLQNILAQLIRQKTVFENKNAHKQAILWIKKQIEHLPVHIKMETSGGYPSLIITTKKTNRPKLWLAAHLDVVEGQKRDFQPKIRAGKLFGRGVFDMKFAVACYIQLLKDLDDNLKNYDLGIMITTDEESGGKNGTQYLLEKKGYRSEVCFLPDGGENWELEKQAKGIWYFAVTSTGKAVHGARPWEGRNALSDVVEFISELKGIFPKEPCHRKQHDHMVMNVEDIINHDPNHDISEKAEAKIITFFMNEQELKKIKARVAELLKKFNGFKINEILFAKNFQINPQNEYVKLLKKIIHEKYGITMGHTVSHGSSDARFFAAKNIPVIAMRPRGGNHHGPNEWIDLVELEKFYEILKLFVKKTAVL